MGFPNAQPHQRNENETTDTIAVIDSYSEQIGDAQIFPKKAVLWILSDESFQAFHTNDISTIISIYKCIRFGMYIHINVRLPMLRPMRYSSKIQ